MTASKRINARLPPELARKVAYLERRTGKSTTEVLLASIEQYYGAVVGEHGLADILGRAGFVGCADGPTDLSASYKTDLVPSLARKA